jgi:regulator of telomere elongation helicase 1
MQVLFPYEPYPQQIEYMDHLLAAVKSSQHTLLEYPNGGGKTLAVLAGCFSWFFDESQKTQCTGITPKLIFICRNFSRIPHVVLQVK